MARNNQVATQRADDGTDVPAHEQQDTATANARGATAAFGCARVYAVAATVPKDAPTRTMAANNGDSSRTICKRDG